MNKFFITLLLTILFSLTATAHPEPKKVLILGASNTWGCVSNCNAVQPLPGYVARLRTLLPDYEIRAVALFGAGAGDWTPDAQPPVVAGLSFPVGIVEYNAGVNKNLWTLFAQPMLDSWKPDYVITFTGWGDRLRPHRNPASPELTAAEYGTALDKIAEGVRRAGAVYVPTLDGSFTLDHYQAEINARCGTLSFACGPNMMKILIGMHYIGTDLLHFNELGHQAVAEEFEIWFESQ